MTWSAADKLVDALATEYVLHGDDHDLASPADLVNALLAHTPRGLEPLSWLANSIDLDTWLPLDIAARVRVALQSPGGSSATSG